MNKTYHHLGVLGALLLLPLAGSAAEVHRYAVVVGENRSNHESIPQLHYADDDAVATHRLLQQAGVESLLLVELDSNSRRLHRGVVAFGTPTRSNLLRAIDKTLSSIEASNKLGASTELLFFYSGHGDVEHGEGYVVLNDEKFSRSDLYQKLLQPSQADRNHVIVDACKSYFLAFEKGPGGSRQPFPGTFSRSGHATKNKTGFVLSTSSDRDSHEWERYQAGIFSHQIRSALRGGADVDADGRISYPELGAFLEVANDSIENPRFRPDFVVKPPGQGGAETHLLGWARETEILTLKTVDLGHVYLENAVGERYFDVNPRPSEPVVLHLPADRPLFLRRADHSAEWRLTDPGSQSSDNLPQGEISVSSKGALHMAFEQLFARPFGKSDVLAYQQKQAQQASSSQPPAPDQALQPMWFAQWATLGMAALGATTGVAANLFALERYQSGQTLSHAERWERNNTIATLNVVAIAGYGTAFVAAAAAVIILVVPWQDPADDSD